MLTTRSRRIARRVVLALAAMLLLLVWYVAGWLAVSHAARHWMIDANTTFDIRPFFAPLISYCDNGLPGGAALSDLWWAATDQPTF